MKIIAIQSFIQLASRVFFIVVTLWAVKGIRTDQWLKKQHIFQGQVLMLFGAIAIGYTVGSFFVDLIFASQDLLYLLK